MEDCFSFNSGSVNGTWFPSGASLYLFWLAIVSLSAIIACLNRGFLISVSVAMMIDFAREPVGGLFGPIFPLKLTGFALMSAMIVGLPTGVSGYITGIVAWYVRKVEGSKQTPAKS